MKISTEISSRIKVISLISMIMVMYIHSINIYNNNTEIILDYSTNISSQIVVFLQLFISDGISRVAVPLFFMLSGYLYFVNLSKFNQIYKIKMLNRIKSLVIPYLFWSFLVIIIFMILQSLPFSSSFFNGKYIVDFDFIELVYAFLVTPLNYPLWFLRDLIIVIFIYAPLIFVFLKFLPKSYLFLLLIIWFTNIDQEENYKWLLRLTALVFFSLGGYLSYYKINIERVFSHRSLKIMILIYLSILLLKTLIQMDSMYTESYIVRLLLKMDILIGVLVLWSITRYIVHNKIVNFLIPFTFLYYVFQEPFISIVKKASFFILGFNAYSSFFVYIITPILAIIFLTTLGILMQKHIPVVSKTITGNRL